MNMLKLEMALAYVLYFSGIYFVYKTFKNRSHSARILMYHRIVDRGGMVTKESFDRQMRYLSRNYSVVSLGQLVDDLKEGKTKKKQVAITIDDGYADNYENAYPILKKYKLPATIFLTTGLIGTKRMPWFDEVLEIVSSSRESKLEMGGRTFNLHEGGRMVAANEIVSFMKTMENNERLRALEELRKHFTTKPGRTMLSWEEAKKMTEIIDFGAHTVTHPILTSLPKNEAKKEITDSQKTIEEKLRRKAELFSYPNGDESDFNDDIKKVVESRFSCAVTTIPGINTINSDLFELKRIGCSHVNDDIIFKVKVSGILSNLIGLYKRRGK